MTVRRRGAGVDRFDEETATIALELCEGSDGEPLLVGHRYLGDATRPNDVVIQDILLAPTPSDVRLGGFFAVTFTGPTCGVEHTGTYAHWHGSGADVRTVRDPAQSLGIREGDVIKVVGGKPLPHSLNSREVNIFIRNASRPMTMYIFRDPSSLASHPFLEVVGESSLAELGHFYVNLEQLQHKSWDLRQRMLLELEKKRAILGHAKARSSDELSGEEASDLPPPPPPKLMVESTVSASISRAPESRKSLSHDFLDGALRTSAIDYEAPINVRRVPSRNSASIPTILGAIPIVTAAERSFRNDWSVKEDIMEESIAE